VRGVVGATEDIVDFSAARWADSSPAALAAIYGLQADGTEQPGRSPARTAALHKVKVPAHLAVVVNAYYAQYFGMPKVADLPPDDPHPERCAYAPPGEQLFSWTAGAL
jgi:hypothetical protein